MFFPCEPKNQAAQLHHKEHSSLKVIFFGMLVRSGKKETRSDLNGDQEIKEQYFGVPVF